MRRRPIQVEVLPDPEALARRAADWILAIALAKRDRVALALSGGSTPRPLYELMGSAAYRDRFPWPRMHWFWGDERYVPPDHPRSNYRMAWDSLLSRVPIPAVNIHPVVTTHVTADRAALDYERTLRSFYGTERLALARPLFDVNLLGLGEDGHLASLFPNSQALAEEARWAISVCGPGQETRITLSYPTLESSAHSAFLVVGASKAQVLAQLRAGNAALPASRFEPMGEFFIFADRAAAPEL